MYDNNEKQQDKPFLETVVEVDHTFTILDGEASGFVLSYNRNKSGRERFLLSTKSGEIDDEEAKPDDISFKVSPELLEKFADCARELRKISNEFLTSTKQNDATTEEKLQSYCCRCCGKQHELIKGIDSSGRKGWRIAETEECSKRTGIQESAEEAIKIWKTYFGSEKSLDELIDEMKNCPVCKKKHSIVREQRGIEKLLGKGVFVWLVKGPENSDCHFHKTENSCIDKSMDKTAEKWNHCVDEHKKRYFFERLQ